MIANVFEGPNYEYMFVAQGRQDVRVPEKWQPIGARDTSAFPGSLNIEKAIADKGFWRGAFATPIPPANQ